MRTMKKILGAGAALLVTTGMANALGLDRSGQDITVLFEDGDHAELRSASSIPSVDGEDVANGGARKLATWPRITCSSRWVTNSRSTTGSRWP